MTKRVGIILNFIKMSEKLKLTKMNLVDLNDQEMKNLKGGGCLGACLSSSNDISYKNNKAYFQCS